MSQDYFGTEVDLRNIRLWLFDLDGTIYKEERLFDGALDLLQIIKYYGGRYVFITNNSSKSVTDYIEKVNKLGIPAEEDSFFTSSQATILWLEKNRPNCKVYCQGTKSLVMELKKAGIYVTEKVEDVDVVLVGFDTELTTKKLETTCKILSTQEVTYIATNPDMVCPVIFGFVPDCGSICEMIRHATGKWPFFIGKPQSMMIDIIMEKFNYRCDETVVVGDRLYTDIATGVNAGTDTICVLTGEATISDIISGDIKPTYTFESVKELYYTLSEDLKNLDNIEANNINRKT